MSELEMGSGIKALVDAGQSVWLDSISRELLSSGRLERYIKELGVTGLTSNPSILAHAIEEGKDYDEELSQALAEGVSDPEEVVYRLAVKDLTDAATLLSDAYLGSGGRDGFVSLEVPPELLDDSQATVKWGVRLRERFAVPNILIKVPGTAAGAVAIEELIAKGIGVNVTLLFDEVHYQRARDAVKRGLQTRRQAGEPVTVPSVASIFVSRWDSELNPKLGADLVQQIGVAELAAVYAKSCEMDRTPEWQELYEGGAVPMRLLAASTSTKDPSYPDTFYVARLVAPDTIDTIPEKTLLAFADHGKIEGLLTPEANEARALLSKAEHQGVDIHATAELLQRQGGAAFLKDWNGLLESVRQKQQKIA